MFQVTFKFIGNEDLQIAYFEREISALAFRALCSESHLITYVSEHKFVILKGI